MERNFYKLLNNSNFGIDCGSNIDTEGGKHNDARS